MRERLGRSRPDPIGGQELGRGALSARMLAVVSMYYLLSCGLSTWC